MAQNSLSYKDLVDTLEEAGFTYTPDGVSLTDPAIDTATLDHEIYTIDQE